MRTKFKKIFLPLFWLCVAATVAVFGLAVAAERQLPDCFYVAENSSLRLSSKLPLTSKRIDPTSPANSASSANHYAARISLWGVIPIKTVQVSVAKNTDVVVLGDTFGIKIFTRGVLITDIQPVDTPEGSVNPALEAGLKKGDLIIAVNGVEIEDTNHAAQLISDSGGESIKITAERDGEAFKAVLKPQYSASEKTYKAGLWIKDSSAGIGTLTFYSPSLNVVAGLGHGVVDTDIYKLLPMSSGEMVPSQIFSFTKSVNGNPGELKGKFVSGSIGPIFANDETGVYATPQVSFSGETVPMALKQEVCVGEAQIITTIDSSGPQSFSCRISKINYKGNEKTKNMFICITDPRLLEQTGGIVQGMSGSPIIQNGKLVGAVTHVLVDDPTRGYAIFAENMLETTQSVAEQQLKEAS